MTRKIQSIMLIAIVVCGVASAQDVTKEKNVSFDVNVGYVPMALFAKDTIGTSFTPAGADISFSALFLRKSYGNMGAELSTSWARAVTMPTIKQLVTHIIPIHVNFVHQYHFDNLLALDSHAGVGMTMYNLQFLPKNENPGLLEFSFSANLGTAMQVTLYEDFYAEIGVNYIVSFPKGAVIQHLIPSLSIGYRF